MICITMIVIFFVYMQFHGLKGLHLDFGIWFWLQKNFFSFSLFKFYFLNTIYKHLNSLIFLAQQYGNPTVCVATTPLPLNTA